MGEVENNQREVPDPLRLDRCPDCGYLLAGLPERGVCPECGFTYTADMIVLYGWGMGSRRSAVNARMGPVEWAVTRMLLVFLATLAAGVESGSGLAMIAAGLLATAYVAYTGYQRWYVPREAPAPAQLRLFPQGFAQRNGIGPVSKLLRWRGRRVYIRELENGRYRIRSWRFLQLQIGSRLRSIDFEWECDDATAERIHQRISAWSAASDAEKARLAADGHSG